MRLPGSATVLGVVYPPEERDSRRRWTDARAALAASVRVPRILADDGEECQLVEDFGSADLAAELAGCAPPERLAWLERAAAAAAAIAGRADPGINPPFERALFTRELALARDAVFGAYLERPLSAAEERVHDAWAAALVEEVLSHPRATCHRDFHGNNLFPLGEAVGVIDFQDVRVGPDSYDLASLLWERSTLDWMTEDSARAVVGGFARRRGLDAAALERRLSRVLLQRAWKACGTFARAIAQGRGEAYRRFLPGELALVRRLLTGGPRDRAFAGVLDARGIVVC